LSKNENALVPWCNYSNIKYTPDKEKQDERLQPVFKYLRNEEYREREISS
jgi:hypothetical protein